MTARDYYGIAFRNIRRQPLRSSLTLIALTLSTCIVMLIVGMSIGGYQAIYGQFGNSDTLQSIIVTPNQTGSGISPFGNVTQVGASKVFTDTTVGQLGALAHVTKAEPRAHIWELASFNVQGYGQSFTMQAEGVPDNASLPLSSGQAFQAGSQSGQVIVGYGYAKALGIAPASLIGKQIAITTQPGYRGVGASIPGPDATKSQADAFSQSTTNITAQIVGVTQPGLDQNSVFFPMTWAHQIRTINYYDNGQAKTTDQLTQDGYSSIVLSVDSLSDVTGVTSAISALGYGETSLLTTVHQLNQLLVIVAVVLVIIAVIALAAAALGVINTMFMAVTEQEFEIGVLRACGARRGTILRIFLAQALLLGFIGGIIGTAVSVPLGSIITRYGTSLLESQGLQPVSLVSISLPLAAGAICLTMIFSILAGIYPSYRAARIDPSEALSSS